MIADSPSDPISGNSKITLTITPGIGTYVCELSSVLFFCFEGLSFATIVGNSITSALSALLYFLLK